MSDIPRPEGFDAFGLLEADLRTRFESTAPAHGPGNGVVTHDPVNHPRHYTAGKVECIAAIEAALGHDGFLAYCRGNAVKYAWRAPRKGGTEDLEKAVWYLQRAITATRQHAADTSAKTFTRPLGAPCD